MNNKFKPGDRVILREDIKNESGYIQSMFNLLGKTMTVKRITYFKSHNSIWYTLEESQDWIYKEEWLEEDSISDFQIELSEMMI